MKNLLLPTFAVLCVLASAVSVEAQAPAEHHALVENYCVSCHNQQFAEPSANPVYLDQANLDDPGADAEIWERVLRKLAVRAMPPQSMPRPADARMVAFTEYLSVSLGRAADEENNPGEFVLHRLNRTEYGNAIRDLLGVEIDVTALLPPDSSDFGFDNNAIALLTSPALLERYLTAAMRISTLAVGDTEFPAEMSVYPMRADVSQESHVEGLPLGTRGGIRVRHNFPADGDYRLFGTLIRGLAAGDSGIEGQDEAHEFEISIDGEQVLLAPIGGVEDSALSVETSAVAASEVAARMQVTTFVTAGPHDVVFTFVEKPVRVQEILRPSARASLDLHNTGGLAELKSVTIEGPFNVTGVSENPIREGLFICEPASRSEETACAEEILTDVARRAYRRPLAEYELEAPMAFYESARRTGDFDAGIRDGLARILASPSFVFRAERDPADLEGGAGHQVSDLELASRLSFFLWNTIPDDTLLGLAEQGVLREPGVLESQVRRMLADERAASMVSDFAGQWLELRNLDRVVPDIRGFPDFDHNLREAFGRETELFFASIVQENRSALELLTADYTFVNERLARHYGISGISGSRFRRVGLTDPNRRGLLGHASVLSLTSAATRTSPVFRGKYILETFLNTPPPPPPANVPALDESAPASEPQSVRERMETHRANPACSGCHSIIDPVGFALENFNPIGQWRETTDDGAPIDSSGVLADGTEVDGPVALRQAIVGRPDAFVGVLTERLMTYALGRGLQAYDMPVVRSVVAAAAENDYRLASIITGIVESRPFQNRTKIAQLDPREE